MGRARCRCSALGSASVRPSNNRRRESTATHIVILAKAGIHGPTIVIPATAGIHGGGGDGFPSARERREAAGAPTIVGENPRPHNRHSREGGNPRGGRAMGSRLHGNDGRRRPTPQSSFPQQRESTAATIVIPAKAGIHGGGPAVDGFPSARERRAATGAPTTVILAKAGIHGGGRRWVPVCTGTTGGGGRTHKRHSREGGNPRRGAGGGWVPVCTGTTCGGGVPTIVGENPRPPISSFPRRRESTAGGRRWMGSRLHGNDVRRRAHPQRHSREWSYARVSGGGNDGARPCGSWLCTRAGRRPSPSRSRRRCCASGRWRSRPPARRRA